METSRFVDPHSLFWKIAKLETKSMLGQMVTMAPDNGLVVGKVDGDDLPARREIRSRIDDLELAIKREILEDNMKPAYGAGVDDDNLTHHFIDGVYARTLFIPEGTVVIGKVHKFPRICIISQGIVSFVTEFGSMCVEAHYASVMAPGTKAAVFAHTDTYWTAIHHTFETDLERLNEIFVADSHDELSHSDKLRLGG